MIKPTIESKILNFTLTEVRNTVEQVRPQFNFNYTQDIHRHAVEMVDSLEGVTAAEVAGLTGTDFGYGKLVPAREISGGWDAERLSFWMLVEMKHATGVVVTYAVGGYTDRRPTKTDAGMNWDDVKFYINSVLQLRTVTSRTAEGVQTRTVAVHADHILADYDYSGISAVRHVKHRPSDVFATMELTSLAEHYQPDVIDTRSMLTIAAALTDRTDAIPAVWLAKIINAYVGAMRARELYGDQDTLRSYARGAVADRHTAGDPFLNVMRTLTGQTQDVSFTLDDVKQLDGDFRKHTVYYPFEDRLSEPSQPEFAVADEATRMNMVLAGTSANALAAKLGITSLSFYVDNNRQGLERLTVTNMGTPGEFGFHQHADLVRQFRDQFLNEVLPTIDFGGQAACRFTVKADIHGETRIYWPVEDEKVARHVIASYADSLMSPLVMSFDSTTPLREQPHARMAFDLETLLNSLSVNRKP